MLPMYDARRWHEWYRELYRSRFPNPFRTSSLAGDWVIPAVLVTLGIAFVVRLFAGVGLQFYLLVAVTVVGVLFFSALLESTRLPARSASSLLILAAIPGLGGLLGAYLAEIRLVGPIFQTVVMAVLVVVASILYRSIRDAIRSVFARMFGVGAARQLPSYLLVMILRTYDDAFLVQIRDRSNWVTALGRVADIIEVGLFGSPNTEREVCDEVRLHFCRAALKIRELNAWVAAPQYTTQGDIREALLDVFSASFSGTLHYLPLAEIPAIAEPSGARIGIAVRNLIASTVPAAILLTLDLTGILPSEVRGWLLASAFLIFSIGVASVFATRKSPAVTATAGLLRGLTGTAASGSASEQAETGSGGRAAPTAPSAS